jgi:hypothetical protein
LSDSIQKSKNPVKTTGFFVGKKREIFVKRWFANVKDFQSQNRGAWLCVPYVFCIVVFPFSGFALSYGLA